MCEVVERQFLGEGDKGVVSHHMQGSHSQVVVRHGKLLCTAWIDAAAGARMDFEQMQCARARGCVMHGVLVRWRPHVSVCAAFGVELGRFTGDSRRVGARRQTRDGARAAASRRAWAMADGSLVV